MTDNAEDERTSTADTLTSLAMVDSQEVLFCYPFFFGKSLDSVTRQLHLCDHRPDVVVDVVKLQCEKAAARSNIVTIRQHDYNSLRNGAFINDGIIDFWLLWISRNISVPSSEYLILSTHFYSRLRKPDDGVEIAARWLKKRNHDIFQKKLILMPVNADLHWSLIAVINLNQLGECLATMSSETQLPFIVHLDSAKMHATVPLARLVNTLINYEQSEKGGFIGSPGGSSRRSLNPVCPTVSQQTNGYDCGLYLCRFALGLLNLAQFTNFTYKDVYQEKSPLHSKISASPMFQFDAAVIHSFRVQLRDMLMRLSRVWKESTCDGFVQSLHSSSSASSDATSDDGEDKDNKSQGGAADEEQPTFIVPENDFTYPFPFELEGSASEQPTACEGVIQRPFLHVMEGRDNTYDEKGSGASLGGIALTQDSAVVVDHEGCYLSIHCLASRNDNPVLNFCAGCQAVLHASCGELDDNNTLWCFTCINSKRFIVGKLLSNNRSLLQPELQPEPELFSKKRKAPATPTEEKSTKQSEPIPAPKPIAELKNTKKRSGTAASSSSKSKKQASSGSKSKKAVDVTKKAVEVDCDPFVGKPVAFGAATEFGKQLIADFKDKFYPDAVCYHLDKKYGHIVGTVLRRSQSSKRQKNALPQYDVVWEFTSLGESTLSYTYLLDGNKEAERLMKRRTIMNCVRKSKAAPAAPQRQSTRQDQTFSDDDVEMEAPLSDNSSNSEGSDGESNAREEETQEWWLFENTDSNLNMDLLESQPNADSAPMAISDVVGLHWDCSATVDVEPAHKRNSRGATVKNSCIEFFVTPISSAMSIFPVDFWTTIVDEVNRYAEQKMSKKSRRKTLVSGYKWKDVTLSEVLTFMGLLIYGMLYPQTGRKMLEWWDSPYKNAWTKFMSKGRFKQICSVLHFSDNDDEDGMATDSLHKIRPLLTILKETLSKFANLGTEFSFDEATMACRSSYGRSLIVYNGMKPTGKFHFKIYVLCCALTNLVHKIKIHTRDNSDRDVIDEPVEAEEMEMNKIDTLTLEMCRPLYNTWSTVNMDNYYMSATCAVHLLQKGVYCRGTIRSSRKFVPKSVLFTSSEVRSLPRGTHRYAVNAEHNMVAVGWIDNKAVHFISTADTTAVVEVRRRIEAEKQEISAPVIVQNYNKYMGGVDRHDRLRSTFSLGKRHHFRKYYVKLFLFLCDIGFTNAWIYYKLCNPSKTKKYGSRADFFEAIAEQLVNPNTNCSNVRVAPDAQGNSNEDRELPDAGHGNGAMMYSGSNFPSKTCIPIPLKAMNIRLSNKMRVCQVCHYEMRPHKWKSVMCCSRHGIRLCTEGRMSRKNSEPTLFKLNGSKVTDWSWTTDSDLSCWDKFHSFYQPEGLFNSNFYVNVEQKKCKFAQCIYTSPLHQKKYNALGIEVKCKPGKSAGMGRIRMDIHLGRMPNNDESPDEEEEEDTASEEGV